MDVRIARTRLSDSEVAGRATAFVFPHLDTGNNIYESAQRPRRDGGPVLQGPPPAGQRPLPWSEVQDIVDTVAITAIQAQQHGAVTVSAGPPGPRRGSGAVTP